MLKIKQELQAGLVAALTELAPEMASYLEDDEQLEIQIASDLHLEHYSEYPKNFIKPGTKTTFTNFTLFCLFTI